MVSAWDLLKFAGSIAAVALIFLVVTKTVYDAPTGYATASGYMGSCRNACGSQTLTEGGNCFCDNACYEKGDCCTDIKRYCV